MSIKATELLSNMKSTAASRFNAAKRLENRERGLTRLTSFTSAYLIGLTVLPYFIKLPPGSGDRINLLTFVLGVVILVASLLQYSARDGVNAEQHYRCGLEIGEMRRRLKIQADSISDADLLAAADSYALILQKYSINHDQSDFDRYRIERKEEAAMLSWTDRIIIPVRIFFSSNVANLILFAMTLLTFGLIGAVIAPAWTFAAP